MEIGRWEKRADWPIQWLQTTRELKILGITYSARTVQTVSNTWGAILGKIPAGVQRWTSDRNWTMLGKVKILYTFILSQAWFVAQILPCPQATVADFERSISYYPSMTK